MRTRMVVVVSLVCGMLVAATLARAQTITLNFISADGNQSGGVYVFPYYFTINSGTHTNMLMCDTFTREITDGESWGATMLSVTNLTVSNVGTLEFGSLGVTTYLEACYLYQEELAAYDNSNADPQGLYNWAVWDLFTGTDPSAGALNNPAEETTVSNYLSAAVALGNAGSLDPSQFAGMYIITPTNTMVGGPQEFFGVCNAPVSVPEPGTVALAALGLGGLLLLRKRS
jgi:PEP-CTERM motif-containing protein